jgi:hypothetical protein
MYCALRLPLSVLVLASLTFVSSTRVEAQTATPVVSESEAPVADFVYRAQRGDTLIGIARRALTAPQRWRDLQQRNQIRNPLAIPLGTPIRIPVAWLKPVPVSAEVLQVIGTAQVAGRAINRGEILDTGAVVVTGKDGFVTLRFADGALVVLQADARLVLRRMQRYEGLGQHDVRLDLESGRAHSSLTPNPAVGRFEIATPVAVSAVRGTEFRTQFSRERTLAGTEVTSGGVQVSGARAAVAVPAGFGATADSSGAPNPPVKLLAAPEWLDPPRQSSRRVLSIEFKPVGGAVEYSGQLARDADFRNVVAQWRGTEPRAQFPMSDDGEHWVRANAIDPNGLVGLDAVHRLDSRILPDAPVLSVPVDGGKQTGHGFELAWAPSDDASGYQVQIASAADFAALLREQTVGTGTSLQLEELPVARYFWRVAARRADGALSEWSSVRSFEQRPAPIAPQLELVDGKAFSASWTAQPGQAVRVQVSRDREFGATVSDQAGVAAPFVFPKASPGKYYVRTQFTDADGYVGPWTGAAEVEVPPPRWIRWMPLASLLLLL